MAEAPFSHSFFRAAVREKDSYIQEAGEQASIIMKLQRDLEAKAAKVLTETVLVAEVDQLRKQVATLQKQIKAKHTQTTEMEAAQAESAAVASAHAAKLHIDLEHAKSKLEELRSISQAKDAALSKHRKEVESSDLELERLSAVQIEFQDAQRQIRQLQGALRERDERLADQQRKSNAATSSLTARLAVAEESLAAANEELMSTKREADKQECAFRKDSESALQSLQSLRADLKAANSTISTQKGMMQELREELEAKEAARSRTAATIKAANQPPNFSALQAKIQAVSTRSGVSTPGARSLSSSSGIGSSGDIESEQRHTQSMDGLKADLLQSQTELGAASNVIERQKETIARMEQDIAKWREVNSA